MNVKFISMNYENSCVYLCFCCVDAVDCGVGRVSCMVMGLTWMFIDRYGLGARPLPPLWIADQVRNDVGVVAGRYSAWRCLDMCYGWRFLYPSGLRIKSAMTWVSCPAGARCGVVWTCAIGGVSSTPLDCGSSPQ